MKPVDDAGLASSLDIPISPELFFAEINTTKDTDGDSENEDTCVIAPTRVLTMNDQQFAPGTDFYWEVEFRRGQDLYDSDPFIFKKLLWRFCFELKKSHNFYTIKLCLLTPIKSTFILMTEFKVHSMLRPAYTRKPLRASKIGPKELNISAIDPFIHKSELLQCMNGNRVLISCRIVLTSL